MDEVYDEYVAWEKKLGADEDFEPPFKAQFEAALEQLADRADHEVAVHIPEGTVIDASTFLAFLLPICPLTSSPTTRNSAQPNRTMPSWNIGEPTLNSKKTYYTRRSPTQCGREYCLSGLCSNFASHSTCGSPIPSSWYATGSDLEQRCKY